MHAPSRILLLGLLATCGCTQPSTEERLCRNSITSSDINPESLAFDSFEAIDRDRMIGYISDGLANTGKGPDQARMEAIETVDGAAKEGVVYSVLHVKKALRTGGSEDQAFACAAQRGSCECFRVPG